MTPRTPAAAATLLIAAALAVPATTASAAPAGQGQKSPYIVTVSDSADARGIARAVQANPTFVYDAALDGFAADLNAGQLRALATNPLVTAVEPDQQVQSSGKPSKDTDVKGGGKPSKDTDGSKGGGNGGGKGGGKPPKDDAPTEEPTEEPTEDAPAEEPVEDPTGPAEPTTQQVSTSLWGLDRIDQELLPLSSTFTYRQTGEGVTAYVIDSGIATAHPDFEGRAVNVFDAFDGNGQDCNGHGTHVAGTIGGQQHGVAKDVALVGLRVLNCEGAGTTSGLIAALDWVTANSPGPAVANLSLGSAYSQAVNDAVTRLSDSGVTVVVAAGNSSVDAGTTSPASATAALTVAASDRYDARASFSNYGAVVDTYAPGVSVTSTWLNGGTARMSGTSMAAPHVAGVAALVKAAHGDLDSATVHAWVVDNATDGVVRDNVAGTVNTLLSTGGL